MPEIEIQLGVPADQHQNAATVYYEAFAGKLGPILRDREAAIAWIARDLKPDRAFVALIDGEVVGIIGFWHRGVALTDLSFETGRSLFGLWGILWRLPLLVLFDREPAKDELLLDGIAVAESARGQGAGSRLLEAVARFAEREGYRQLRLDVVDTNPRAKALYERRGYEAIAHERYGILSRWLGFEGSTQMVRRLG